MSSQFLTVLNNIQEYIAQHSQINTNDTFTITGDIINLYPTANHILVVISDNAKTYPSLTLIVKYDILTDLIKSKLSIDTRIEVIGHLNIFQSQIQLNVTSLAILGESTRVKNIKTWTENYKKFFKENNLDFFPIKHLAVISSKNSQGVSDFKKHLNINNLENISYRYVNTLSSTNIANAIIQLNRENNVDCIIIVRGGGSQLDLFEFNKPDLIQAMTKSHIPIMTGLGHTDDNEKLLCNKIADYAANTPTDAANVINRIFAIINKQELLENDAATAAYFKKLKIDYNKLNIEHNKLLQEQEVLDENYNELSTNIEKLEEDYTSLKSANDGLKEDYDKLLLEIGNLNIDIIRKDDLINKLESEIKQLKHNYNSTTKLLQKYSSKIPILTKEITDLRNSIAEKDIQLAKLSKRKDFSGCGCTTCFLILVLLSILVYFYW